MKLKQIHLIPTRVHLRNCKGEDPNGKTLETPIPSRTFVIDLYLYHVISIFISVYYYIKRFLSNMESQTLGGVVIYQSSAPIIGQLRLC